MAENLNVFGFEVTDDDMTLIAALGTATSVFFDHRDPNMASQLGNYRVTWHRQADPDEARPVEGHRSLRRERTARRARDV